MEASRNPRTGLGHLLGGALAVGQVADHVEALLGLHCGRVQRRMLVAEAGEGNDLILVAHLLEHELGGLDGARQIRRQAADDIVTLEAFGEPAARRTHLGDSMIGELGQVIRDRWTLLLSVPDQDDVEVCHDSPSFLPMVGARLADNITYNVNRQLSLEQGSK